MEKVNDVEVIVVVIVVVVVDDTGCGPKICSLIAMPPQYSYVYGGELPGQN